MTLARITLRHAVLRRRLQAATQNPNKRQSVLLSDIFLEISTHWCKFQALFGQVKNRTFGKYDHKQQRVISVKILFGLYRQIIEGNFLPVLKFLRKITWVLNYMGSELFKLHFFFAYLMSLILKLVKYLRLFIFEIGE